eukprot:sb/3468948/
MKLVLREGKWERLNSASCTDDDSLSDSSESSPCDPVSPNCGGNSSPNCSGNLSPSAAVGTPTECRKANIGLKKDLEDLKAMTKREKQKGSNTKRRIELADQKLDRLQNGKWERLNSASCTDDDSLSDSSESSPCDPVSPNCGGNSSPNCSGNLSPSAAVGTPTECRKANIGLKKDLEDLKAMTKREKQKGSNTKRRIELADQKLDRLQNVGKTSMYLVFTKYLGLIDKPMIFSSLDCILVCRI